MKKITIVLIVLMPVIIFGQADTSRYWKTSGIMGINLNQASFSNWTAGGVNSVAFSAMGKFYADYKKEKFTWNNSLNLTYGMVKNQGETLKKAEDIIDLTSVVGHDISKKWAFVGYINFRTQFADGYDAGNDTNRISTFMSPAYLTISPAFRYMPAEWFSLFLSPATAKFTFVLDQELADGGAFGVTPGHWNEDSTAYTNGEHVLLYLGPFLEAYLKKDLAKNLHFESKLNILYTFLNRDNLEPFDMDVSWENFLNYKMAKYFSVSLFLHLVYLPGQPVIKFENYQGAVRIDAKPNRKLQIKETVGIGITYSFPNVK